MCQFTFMCKHGVGRKQQAFQLAIYGRVKDKNAYFSSAIASERKTCRQCSNL
jgi:hypothetical protein